MIQDDLNTTTDSEWIIVTELLTKKFDKQVGVEDLNLQIPKNSIFGFIGPSGCGKTTTVRLLLGIYPPTSGKAMIFGHEPHRFSLEDREKIGYMPQLFMLQQGLSVWQNLAFTASLYGMRSKRSERIKYALDLVELTGHEKKSARNLSGGMQRRLSLAASLLHTPELIFLDEPTAGIDPVLRRKIWDHFQTLKNQGRTLFITTQYVSEAAYCDYVGVMSNGHLLMVETPENLKKIGLGGEIIELCLDGFISTTQMEQLSEQAFVTDKRVKILENLKLQLIVNDAAEAMPALLQWCANNGIKVQEAQKLEPSFDDIFVQVIERHRNHA